MSLPSPPQMGAPARFARWRDGQDDAVVRLLSSEKRFLVNDAATGVGKSLINMVCATGTGSSMEYDTSTKGLQDQLGRDYGSIGLMDVRGMTNYPCLELPPRVSNTCDKGPCLDGIQCRLKFSGCHYYDALREARAARLTSTNYALHLALARNDEGLGQRDLLVLDEAHDAAEHLSKALTIKLPYTDDPLVGQSPDDLRHWKARAEVWLKSVMRDIPLTDPGTSERRELVKLKTQLERLIGIAADEQWVWTHSPTYGLTIEPVWAAPYAERYLFRGVEKVILSSATLRPAALKYLGLQPEDYEFVSTPSPFPAWRRPIIQVECAQVKWGMDDHALTRWIDTIESIIAGRLDRKGIIHAVSYDRAKQIKASSRFDKIMLLPSQGNTRQVVEAFKAMPPPAVLVSPSVHTGYDFPYDTARYQIVAKLPFPPIAQSPILSIRQAQDSGYRDWVTASTLVQMAGRVVRAVDDMGETFITDDQATWFLKRRALFPAWFREALQRVKSVPPPPALSA